MQNLQTGCLQFQSSSAVSCGGGGGDASGNGSGNSPAVGYSKWKGDLVLQTCHVIELVTKMFLVVQNAAGKAPEVNVHTE